MDTLKKFLAPILLVALCAVGALSIPSGPDLPAAHAQDTWTGHKETTECCSLAVGATTAQIFTAVSGKALIVKSFVVRLSAAGVLSFQSGSGGATLAQYYLEANKPYTVDQQALGKGFGTASGSGLYAVCDAAATVTITARVRQE